jgi:hypothetical protein
LKCRLQDISDDQNGLSSVKRKLDFSPTTNSPEPKSRKRQKLDSTVADKDDDNPTVTIIKIRKSPAIEPSKTNLESPVQSTPGETQEDASKSVSSESSKLAGKVFKDGRKIEAGDSFCVPCLRMVLKLLASF